MRGVIPPWQHSRAYLDAIETLSVSTFSVAHEKNTETWKRELEPEHSFHKGGLQ